MENLSLHHLQHILTDEIFLLKEDRSNHAPAPIKKVTEHEIQEIPEEKKETESNPAKEPIQVRGNFEKGILILHEEEELAASLLEMLANMIKAVGHSMNEVGLLSSKELEGRSLEEFTDLNAHTVLKFGRIKHPINALPALEYDVHTEEETEYLFADALSTISEDKNLKRKLWNTLQILFNISKHQ